MDVSEVDFGDFDNAKAWFETQPQEVSVLLASRSALRVLPYLEGADDVTMVQIAFAAFRATIISSVASTWPTDEIKGRAATDATLAATDATRAATDATLAATDAAALNGETRKSSSALRDQPVWLEGIPDDIEARWRSLRGRLQADAQYPGAWGYWIRWYDGLLTGNSIDWDLCYEIARITPEEWDKGPSHIADLIREIEADLLRQRTEILPPPVLDEEDQVWRFPPDQRSDDEEFKFQSDRVRMRLSAALAEENNGLTEHCSEAIQLRMVFEHHDRDPSHLAVTFVEAGWTLSQNLTEGVYPQNPSLNLLANALTVAREEICSRHPKAKERCEKLGLLPEVVAPLGDARKDILNAPRVLEEIVDDDVREALEVGAREITSVQKPSRGIAARFINIVTTISEKSDRMIAVGMKAEKAIEFLGRLMKFLSELLPF